MRESVMGASTARVLVVDDDVDICRLIECTLGDAGFAVESVPDGTAALQTVQRARPNLILLDVHMPGLDGWQVLAELRAATGRQTPVVVMTAGFAAQEQALATGAQGFLGKPFDLDDLLAAVEAHAGLLVENGSEMAVPHRTALSG